MDPVPQSKEKEATKIDIFQQVLTQFIHFDKTNGSQDQNLELLIELIDYFEHRIREYPEYYEIFNNQFLRKIVKLLESTQYEKIYYSLTFMNELFSKKMISNRLINQKGNERQILELINDLLSLEQQLKHTHFELFIHRIKQVILPQDYQDNEKCNKFIKVQKEVQQQLKISLKKFQEQNNNNEFINMIQNSLCKCESVFEQQQLFTHAIQNYILEYLLIIKLYSLTDQISHLSQILAFYERLVFKVEYNLIVDHNNIRDPRYFILKNEKYLLEENFGLIFKGLATLLNMILQIPFNEDLNKRAFYIIKQLYLMYPEYQNHFIGPITLVLRNISQFALKEDSQYKDTVIFLYNLIHSSQLDEQVKQNLLKDEHLCYLRENKYFSVKALALNEEEIQLKNLTLPVFFPCFTVIQAASIYVYSINVKKPFSLVYWSFRTLDYDIQFGLFKLLTVDDYGIQDYVGEKHGIVTMMKTQRVDSHKSPVTIVTIMSTAGFYRIVFDNSYSYLRAKQLFFSIQLLEPK
ncbi:hypothetical protein pb186bvf_012350 [Paramecium bursaria]